MSRFGKYFNSTIGRKQVMGLTGLGLSLFVLTHMLGNLLMFVGPDAYNMYGHKLTSNPAIYLAEAGLLFFFFAHVINAVTLKLKNKSAREQSYATNINGEKAISVASKTMIHTGMIIGIFAVLHLITFKFGPVYTTTIDDEQVRDLYKLMVEVFRDPIYVAWYVFSMIMLGFHLSHGVASAIKTLGFNHPRYNCGIECASQIYGWVVALGFTVQPIYIFLNY